MADTIVESPIFHGVLNSDNYEEWTIRLKNYLKAHNLWDVVESNDETPEEGSSVTANDDHCSEQGKSKKVKGKTSGKGKSKKVKGKSKKAKGETSRKGQSVEANDEAKNIAALKAIHISCGSDAFSVIKDTDSAKEAWKILKEKYGPTGKDKTFKYEAFFEAVRNIEDDWSNVEKILKEHTDIISSTHPVTGETGLHVAATAGNEKIMKKLVELVPEDILEIQDKDNKCTALTEVVMTGMTSIAKCMVEKNKKIVSIAGGPDKSLPVVDAVSYGYKDMAYYLYCKTPKQDLSPEKDLNNAVALLVWSIDAKDYDIALDMLNRFPRLAITKHDEYGSPVVTLAQNPAMFPSTSTCRLNFWQRWIYDRIDRRSTYDATNDIYINVQNGEDSQTGRKNICCTGLLKLRSYISKLLGIEHIRKMKFGHDRTKEILQKMCEVIKTLDDNELENCSVVDALHKATAKGMVEFFVALIRANPGLLWMTEENTDRNLFMLAVQHRQPKIFSHIHDLKSRRAIAAWGDSSENNMLHMAGFLAPSSHLSSIAGPALQMQRELQWFEEVEKVTPPSLKELRNSKDETPQELFAKSHEDLKEKGEKWMKDTAQSCTVPAALIVTIMFAAAFTVPGGLIQDTGRPLLLHDKFFRLFIISDAVSLFSSAISVIMFLGILSSPYREADFLRSLPTKLMIGLFTLFLSIVAMMICFSAALLILFDGESWVIFPIILSSSLPIILYLILQFSLVFEIFKSTYGSSIFERKQRRWL